MTSAGLEPANPGFKKPQTYDFDRTAIGIDISRPFPTTIFRASTALLLCLGY